MDVINHTRDCAVCGRTFKEHQLIHRGKLDYQIPEHMSIARTVIRVECYTGQKLSD